MKSLFVCFAALLVTVTHAQPISINYDIFINDKSYLQSQLTCVLGEKQFQTCDRIGNRLRLHLLPDVAKTGICKVCNEHEKIYIVKVAQKIKNNFPADWNRIMDIYKVEPSLRDTLLQKEITT